MSTETKQEQAEDQRTERMRTVLIAVMAFQGLSGVAGGLGLIADPSGASLQIPLDWLIGSPFTNYLVPGIILFVVLGQVPLAVVFGLWKRKSWARLAAIGVGTALCIWIFVEILVIGYQPDPPLQAVYGIVGMVILLIAVTAPRAR